MLEILEFVLGGFWRFIGFVIIFYIAAYLFVNGILNAWVRFTRMMMVRKHGWPPSHLDADGDWKPKKANN